MRLTVNGKEYEMRGVGVTVAALVVEMGLGKAAVAVEVNRELVRKREHGARVLSEGDIVELVTLVGGG